MNLGFWEILLIAMVVLVFFGPSRLPGLGRSIGAAIKGLKQGLREGEIEAEDDDYAKYREFVRRQEAEKRALEAAKSQPAAGAQASARPIERENSPTI